MRKTVFLAFILVVPLRFTEATGEFYDAFIAHYKVPEASALTEKSCGVCHVSDEDFAFNSYGKSLQVAMKSASSDTLDSGTLVAVESEDSDADGNSNLVEIQANTLPGDPTSGAKPGVTPAPENKPERESVIPKNAFHPAVVHFPIALFIGGLVLDALGLITKHRTMLVAGWYNLIFAAVAAFGGIASGLMAMTFKGYPMSGKVQEHLLLAVISTVLMWAMVLMRVHRHEKMQVGLRTVYYLLAFVALFLISWAGHVGGDLVYG